MLESIGFCLIISILLGLSTSWFLSKGSVDVTESKIRELSNSIREKDSMVKELESSCIENKNQLNRLIDDGIVCRHKLLQSTNLLRKKSDELYKVEKRLKEVRLKVLCIDKMGEGREVIVSEVFREERYKTSIEIKKMANIIREKDRAIATLMKGDSPDKNYTRISKDQFYQIEKRLKEYKSMVDILENKNSKLLAQSRLKKKSGLGDDITLYLSNLKEMTLSNLFEKEHNFKQV